MKTIPFTLVTQILKYLGINQKVKDLCTGNYRALMKYIYTNKLKIFHVLEN